MNQIFTRFHLPRLSKSLSGIFPRAALFRPIAGILCIASGIFITPGLFANVDKPVHHQKDTELFPFLISPSFYPTMTRMPFSLDNTVKPAHSYAQFILLQSSFSPPLSPMKDEQITPVNPPATSVPSQSPNTPPYSTLPVTEQNADKAPPLDYPISIVLSPLYKAVLSSQLATDVITISKKMGDPFTKGEVLILLNPRVFKAKVQKAEAVVERARHALFVKQRLYQDQVASSIEMADTKAALEVALAELAIAKKDLSDTIIKAPFSGNVVDVYVEEHEMVQPGQKLIAIVDSSTLVAKMLVPSMYLKDLYIGQPIQLRIRETHDLIQAKITQIGVVIDPASSMVKVFAEIDNHDGRLTAGMIGTAKIENFKTNQNKKPSSDHKTDSLRVPKKTIQGPHVHSKTTTQP